MQVTTIVSVSAKDFFNSLSLNLMRDIAVNTGKHMTLKEIANGYRYTKVLKKDNARSNLEIKIHKLVAHSEYHVSYNGAAGNSDIHYLLAPIDDSSCRITYTEIKKPSGLFKKFLNVLDESVLKFRYVKKVTSKLNEMAGKIEKSA